MSCNNYSLGWRPDKPDFRDHKFKTDRTTAWDSIYLSDKYNLGAVYDQGQLGSCVGNAVAFACHFDLLNKFQSGGKINPFRPSRLYIYYYGRTIEGTTSVDAGLEIRDGVKAVNAYGIPSEDIWLYDIAKFTTEPTLESQTWAKKLSAFAYQRVDNTSRAGIITALKLGFPVVFGMTVFDSFLSDEVAQTGIVAIPVATESVAGGHAMAIVGYHAGFDCFIVRNSWGSSWGQGGYCRIPATYLVNPSMADDFWIISSLAAS